MFCTIPARNGERVALVLDDENITPTQLRSKISDVTKIPLGSLRLIFRGRMIKDDDNVPSVVTEYKLENDSVLHCMGPVEMNTSSNASSPASGTPAVADPFPATVTSMARVVPPLSTSTASTTITH